MRLIRRGLSYLRPAMRSAHWRVYAVRDATTIAAGAARLQALGPDWFELYARRAGTTLLVVEQHVDRALRLAEDVVLLTQGRVAYRGPTAELGDLVERLLPGAPV